MRVYVEVPRPMSMAMDRVVAALKSTAGAIGFEVVSDEAQAELVVLHVIGMTGLPEKISELRAAGKRFAIVQYCLRTTEATRTDAWVPIWREAVGVWSYYDLEALHREDHPDGAMSLAEQGVHLWLAPLGADARVFRPYNVPRRALVMTSGYVAATEGVIEAARAVRALDGRMIHLGPQQEIQPALDADPLAAGVQVGFSFKVPDGILAQQMSRVQFVSGLRRGEGFELPAAEGLLCGARPVMFDRPHYRQWFDGLAEFVPEGSAEEVAAALQALFAAGARPVTQEERALAAARFDWRAVTEGFWSLLKARQPAPAPSGVPRGTSSHGGARARSAGASGARPHMLFVGDAVVSTGFARSARAYVDGALAAGWDVDVLGLNYNGDPHDWPCPVWPCAPGGDLWGIGRLRELIQKLSPTVVVVQNDPWNLPRYMKAIGPLVPTVAVLAVDGKNMAKARELNGLAGAIFWTEFGLGEARKGGYVGEAAVVPLGVDQSIYRPQSKAEMRRLVLAPKFADKFIIGCANRNQPRKRLDLLISYFASWVKSYNRDDAYLFLHVAPTGDQGYDVVQLMAWHGLGSRLILNEPEMGFGMSERSLAAQYATWDACAVTTQGEGWGLTVMEAMACGVPALVPDWAALGEWTQDGALLVPVTEIAVTPNFINVLGGIADRDAFVRGLEQLYTNATERETLAQAGLGVVSQPQFRWDAIGAAFAESVQAFLDKRSTALDAR